MRQRAAIEVTGLVQGVGFRPFVYTLATELALRGFVQNRGGHVFVDVEGEPGALATFIDRLTAAPPATAAIERVQSAPLALMHYRQFVIEGSAVTSGSALRVPPDVATCDDCLQELFDPANRRHRHPFITCTSCGPRFSIIRKLPYDRAGTTMDAFPMCERCRAEYADPRNRRFHAQSIACLECGPSLAASGPVGRAQGAGAMPLALTTLLAGGIVAIKGIGGFHLACDATNASAVAELRRRKGREARPMAVMVSDAVARGIGAAVSAEALSALTAADRPIVLMARSAWRLAGIEGIADSVAEGSPAIGLLLPYTPIHHLLLREVARPLVMTSGNRRDEPMVCDDASAVALLGDIADLFLTHDRDIHVRCDDSVVRVEERGASMVRRSRGSAPSPLRLADCEVAGGVPAVLAVGGHLKNTFCLTAGANAYLSPHIGTLDSAATYQAFSEAVQQMSALLGIQPEVIAHDHHPDYASTRLALSWPGTSRVAVQHHHAHVLSCVAEHACTEPVIGVAFDGAGLGTDGAVWGGEFLVVEGVDCRRAAHLAYVPLPGGDVAAREPWRMAVAHLAAAVGPGLGPLGDTIATRVSRAKVDFVQQMIARGVCSPPTSSVGRLFDAVAAMIGSRDVSSFEGQAAMELEVLASSSTIRPYQFDLNTVPGTWMVDASPVIRQIAADVAAGRNRGDIAAAFHGAVATMIATVAAAIARQTGIRRVALTGGVFQNALLGRSAVRALHADGLDVLEHHRVPCNDGGLSLGQALFAVRAAKVKLLSGEQIACA